MSAEEKEMPAAGEAGDEITYMYDDGIEMGETQSDLSSPRSSRSMDQATTAGMSEEMSFTRKNYPKIAVPTEVPRPRGLARKVHGDDGHPAFTVPRTHSPVRKTLGSRILYTMVLLNMVVWIPMWLKLITIRRRTAEIDTVSLFDPDVKVNLNVSTFEDRDTACYLCDKSNYAIPGISFPVTAHVYGFRPAEKVQTASYVLLLASFDWKRWYVVNTAGILTGIPVGTSENQVCMDGPKEDDDALIDDTLEDDELEVLKTVYKKDTIKFTKINDDYDGIDDKGMDRTEIVDEKIIEVINETIRTPAPRPGKEHVSHCCLGNPGFVYLVACVTPNAEMRTKATDADGFYKEIRGPPFDDRCIAITSKCDYSCDSAAVPPVTGTCVDGVVPIDELMSPKTLNPGAKNKERKRHFDRHFKLESARGKFLHTTFVLFILLSTISTWISFLPGAGYTDDSVIPSINEVEEHMEAHGEDQKPLCLVAFSISALEPRMMVLRNLCGKMIAWVNHRKFTFMSSTPARDVLNSNNANLAKTTLFNEDDRNTFINRTHPPPPPPPLSTFSGSLAPSTALKLCKVQDRSDYLNGLVEVVDIFQDEGHRVGCYALWDAFVDIVHDGDLQFVQCMAGKMNKMSANDDMLQGKKPEDLDADLLLDDELRSLINKPATGVTQVEANQLELAFACYDLLSALGHHFFWRADIKIDIVGFRSLASDSEAVRVLRLWAKNFAEASKRGLTNPFGVGITPLDDPGIKRKVWEQWWELYSDLGRTQWQKRFDVTKFRLARLHYFRQGDKIGDEMDAADVDEEIAKGNFRNLIMCYSARANPEELVESTILPENVRGIRNNVFARLKGEFSDESNANLLRHHIWGRRLTRSEARRCHGRVVGFLWKNGRRHVRLRECTPELLEALPTDMLTWRGQAPSDLDYDTSTLLNSHGFCGDEAAVPIDMLEPLLECRGKSGGMNHAMEIMTNYIRHHSSTFELIRRRHGGKMPAKSSPLVEAHMLFAIFDCRHMATEGFWDAVVPYFYRYKHPDNPWARELIIDRKVAFVQLPQTYTGLSLADDIFDMRNEYLFRMANTVRSGVGAITSCGTNAVWNYDVRYQENAVEHRFNEDTMIEDTASSHDVIIVGRKGVYHFERLVLGARKGTSDYLAAVFRWSKGAVQLFWTTFYYPRYKYLWPWIALVLHVIPIVATVIYLQMANLDKCHQTELLAKTGIVPCRLGPVFGLVFDPIFLLYAIYMTVIASACFWWPTIGAQIIMFENVTYFFSATSAFYWIAVPIFMCVARQGIPSIFDPQVVTFGGLFLQLHMGAILTQIKNWAPLEAGRRPADYSLLRSQQMFFITAPLHLLAILYGCVDGLQIVAFGKDASRWASFDSVLAIVAAKTWALLMVFALIASIGVGAYRYIAEDGASERIERLLGIMTCLIVLYLIETPARAMFFYKRVKASLAKPSWTDRLTKTIFSVPMIIRPDYLYIILWASLLLITLQTKKLDKSHGIFNTKTRCEIDDAYTGCQDDD